MLSTDDVSAAAKSFFDDVTTFYYHELEPVIANQPIDQIAKKKANSIPSRFNSSDLGDLVAKLDVETRTLIGCLDDLKQDPDSRRAIELLRTFAHVCYRPTEIRYSPHVEDTYIETLIARYDNTHELDCVSQYLEFVDSAISRFPSSFTYSEALRFSLAESYSHNKAYNPERFPATQAFRKGDIGRAFQKYFGVLLTHLGPDSTLGKAVSNKSKLSVRKIPTLRQAFRENKSTCKSPKGKGYAELDKILISSPDWDAEEFHEQMSPAYRRYQLANSNVNKANTLLVEIIGGPAIVFEKHNPKPIRFSGLRGYTQQKKEFRAEINRLRKGLPSNHIVLSGPPGTGKTSLVLAAANAYAGMKFIFLDNMLNDNSQIKRIPVLLNLLSEHNHKFLVYADDTKYDDSSKTWDHVRSLIEGTSEFNPNVRLVFSTNYWNEFPLAFKSRFGKVIEFPYPDSATLRSIAEHHKTKYGVGEDIEFILDEAKKRSEEGISGRSIEQVCARHGIYSVEPKIIELAKPEIPF